MKSKRKVKENPDHALPNLSFVACCKLDSQSLNHQQIKIYSVDSHKAKIQPGLKAKTPFICFIIKPIDLRICQKLNIGSGGGKQGRVSQKNKPPRSQRDASMLCFTGYKSFTKFMTYISTSIKHPQSPFGHPKESFVCCHLSVNRPYIKRLLHLLWLYISRIR